MALKKMVSGTLFSFFFSHKSTSSNKTKLFFISAHNLESNTDLKLRYLEQAIPNLEPSKDPNVMTTLQQTIPTTMSTVHQQLTIFAQANPNKKIKMLLMAIQTLKS